MNASKQDSAQGYKIAILGSGAAGMSAAAHAAESGISHLLLESTVNLCNTIHQYQKGKFVMAEPAVLPLRSPLEFKPGSREQILDVWHKGIKDKEVNVRFNIQIDSLQGEKGNYRLTSTKSEVVSAEYVVMAMGVQGNLRKLGVAGEDLPQVQYQLDDPGIYEGETIVVIGAGDAAIENALALTKENNVLIVNRRDEFNRAKQTNLDLILQAIDNGNIECMYETTVSHVEKNDSHNNGEKPCTIILNAPNGEAKVSCDRIIARLGGVPPRKFIESCGIHFPNDDPAAFPVVDEHYESNVPGIYIIGTLSGYPLIKGCMNQGYEVIEYIEGNKIEPADEPLLWDKFKNISEVENLTQGLQKIYTEIPLFSGLTIPQLREFMLDSDILQPEPNSYVFKHADYTDTFFSILKGEVHIHTDLDDPDKIITLRKGNFFGEMSLIAGRRRNASVTAGHECIIIETPRRTMNKLINSVVSVKDVIDKTFMLRAIQNSIAPDTPVEELSELIETAKIHHYKLNDIIIREGEIDDNLHLIRSGSVLISKIIGDREVSLNYLAAGNYFGELAVLTGMERSAKVRAATTTETISLEGVALRQLFHSAPYMREKFEQKNKERVMENIRRTKDKENKNIISFLVDQGLGEATDVLLIDESICVRCDYCEKACAETHNGTSLLNREAGPTYASIHVPTSCRHCEHPHCMKECPPDAIHRAPNGEVFINDTCIGCGKCEQNCPYDVIQMSEVRPHKSNLISWLLFGRGTPPGMQTDSSDNTSAQKKAVKCDMCKDMSGGPACVRACPTGAALRASPEEFMSISQK